MDYISLARLGKNDWWRYLLAFFTILAVWLGSGIFLGIVLAVMAGLGMIARTGLDTVAGSVRFDSGVMFVVVMLTAAVLFLCVLAVVRFIHQRPLRSLVTPYARIAWKRVAVGFALMIVLSAASSVVEAVLFPGRYQLTFQPVEFFKFLPLILIFVPFQTAGEELLFRGYMMQGLALRIRQPLVVAGISSFVFMLLHLFNPEVPAEPVLLPIYYFGYGMLMALITLKDNRLELAIGAHAGCNMFTTIFATYPNSVLPTPALFTLNVLDVRFGLVAFVITSVIFYLALFARRKNMSATVEPIAPSEPVSAPQTNAIETMPQVAEANATSAPSSPLSTLLFWASGLVLSCTSPTFYYQAARRRLAHAIGFFFLFAFLLTLLQSLQMGVSLNSFREKTDQAFARGTLPEVTISHGIATIRGPDPYVLINNGTTLFVLDTTGKYTPSYLTSRRYNTAILVTKANMYMVNQGKFYDLELSDVQDDLGEPFEFNARFVKQWVDIYQIIAIASLALWNSIVRLVYILPIGLLLWAGAYAFRRGTKFSTVLVTGLYALVPAMYAGYLLSLVSIRFCGVNTLLLILAWSIALVPALVRRESGILSGRRPLRSWRTLFGIPMLVVIALNAIFTLPDGVLWVWSATVATLLVLLGIGVVY